MPNKPKSENEKKTCELKVWLTFEEKEQIKELASKLGYPGVSSFIRDLPSWDFGLED